MESHPLVQRQGQQQSQLAVVMHKPGQLQRQRQQPPVAILVKQQQQLVQPQGWRQWQLVAGT
jgi:hypothetical protein